MRGLVRLVGATSGYDRLHCLQRGAHVLKFIVIGLIVVLVLWAVGMYNGLIKLRNLVQEAWRQIDVELKRRHDLIPNLVETVKGYAAHEKGTLEGVMQARSAAMSGGQTPAAAAQSEGILSQALGLEILRTADLGQARDEVARDGLDLGVELTDVRVVVAATRRDTVLGRGQLLLQRKEVLVGLEVRVGLGNGEQPP